MDFSRNKHHKYLRYPIIYRESEKHAVLVLVHPSPILGLFEAPNPITIGLNFRSEKLGRKGLIKVEDKFFTPEDVNTLALVCPDVVINVIRDYRVTEKITVHPPRQVVGLVKCTNPKCITNNEPMESSFTLLEEKPVVLQCNYCTRKVHGDEIVFRH